MDVSCTCLLQLLYLRLRRADRFGVRRRRSRRSLLGTAPLLGELLLCSGAGGLRLVRLHAGRLREGSEKAPRRLRQCPLARESASVFAVIESPRALRLSAWRSACACSAAASAADSLLRAASASSSSASTRAAADVAVANASSLSAS